ncbi:MAG TPA: TetR family transcriptional regulator [Alphaproteobacteria bacterium]|nr:TetR family transcriptional regulator [Alphaproteobacteria bacterium]
MARQALFTSQAFVDAAIELVAEGGGAAATLQAIARKVGGPTGSIYHRFQSRAEIMASAWISIHGQFSRRLRAALEQGGALAAALAIPDWARRDAIRARFLLLNDPGALIGGNPPEALRGALEREEQELEAAFQDYVRSATGSDVAADLETQTRARFLIFDAPIALTSPHLAAGDPIPGFVDTMIRELHAGVALALSVHGSRAA